MPFPILHHTCPIVCHGLLCLYADSPDTVLALFPSAYIAMGDPSFKWIMAYLAQDEGAQEQLKSSRLSATDGRESKYVTGDRNNQKFRASFVADDIVGELIPVNGKS